MDALGHATACLIWSAMWAGSRAAARAGWALDCSGWQRLTRGWGSARDLAATGRVVSRFLFTRARFHSVAFGGSRLGNLAPMSRFRSHSLRRLGPTKTSKKPAILLLWSQGPSVPSRFHTSIRTGGHTLLLHVPPALPVTYLLHVRKKTGTTGTTGTKPYKMGVSFGSQSALRVGPHLKSGTQSIRDLPF
jgi:hypothetical protein